MIAVLLQVISVKSFGRVCRAARQLQFTEIFKPLVWSHKVHASNVDTFVSTIIKHYDRGSLEMVHLEVAAWYAQDSLKGDNVTELRVKFIRKIEDTVPAGDD